MLAEFGMEEGERGREKRLDFWSEVFGLRPLVFDLSGLVLDFERPKT
jgi:hypothetical protein